MKIQWGKTTYTFLIIPDPERPVLRLRVAALFLYLLPLLALTLVTAMLALYTFHLKSVVANKQLAEQIEWKNRVISGKDHAIEKLETELIDISEQAKTVQDKLEELKMLEGELRSLQDKPKGSTSARSSAMATQENRPLGQAGGDLVPVSAAAAEQMAASTKRRLSALHQEMDAAAVRLQKAKRALLAERVRLKRTVPSIFPVDRVIVTSLFGIRRDPFTEKPSFHGGIDLGGRAGDPIYVTADGTVEKTGKDRVHGNNIIVIHRNGVKTWYVHLSKILVQKGDTVLQGQKIGLMGSTGRSTGPHLHYEVLVGGKKVDPKPYMKEERRN